MAVRGPRAVTFGSSTVVLALLLAACSGAADGGSAGTGGESGQPVAATELPQASASPWEGGPSALRDPADGALPPPLVDVDRLVSGGPPPDGIPSIDRPKFLRAGDVTFLDPAEPVLAFETAGEARAYPVQILIWHEIVNDTVGGVPVAVTYCPLCNSALAFDRRAAGRVLEFGTSGLLYNSDLVMYDRQTRSLWPQLEGRAVAGVLTGTELTPHVVSTVSWHDWQRAHPNDWVLSRDTGHTREYGRNPYVGYDNPDTDPFLLDADADPRLPAKTRVIGLRDGTDAVAVSLDALTAAGTMEVSLAGRTVVLFARPGLASALDSSEIADGRRIGASAVFEPEHDGERLHFTADGEHFVDAETGTRWTLLGEGIDGPLRGERLTPVHRVETFWFAWAAFLPNTRIVR